MKNVGVIKAVRAASAEEPTADARPLYQRLARALREDIASGVYPVGSQLPTEVALCERYGVSRHTVREALRLLRDDGLVTSRRGAGTVVIPPSAVGDDIQQLTTINDLVAFSTDTRLAIEAINTVVLDAGTAARTGLVSGDTWLAVRALRLAGEDATPVCRTEYYINRAFAAVGRILPRHKGPIFPLIEDLYGQSIVVVQQTIAATLVDRSLGEDLQVAEGSAALEVRRTYRTADDQVAQVTINTHPAARFQHSMTLRRVKS